MFIGADANIIFGVSAGFFTGFGWVATMLGILYLFEMKSMKAYLINAGYCIIAFNTNGLNFRSLVKCYMLIFKHIKWPKEAPFFHLIIFIGQDI